MHRIATLTAVLALTSGMAYAETAVPGVDFLFTWDADSDGMVTLAEATERRAGVWMMFDADGNGVWSPDELLLIDEHLAAEAEAKAEAMKVNDQANGFVRGIGAGKGLDASAKVNANNVSALANLDMYDADKNGVLSEAEYVEGTAIWVALRDRNGDGVISMEDFGRGH